MNTLPKAIGILVLVLFGTLASSAAMAQYRGHGGYGHGGYGHGGNVRFGISFGAPFYGPGYFPAPYYPYPAYAYPAPVYAYPPVAVQSYSPPVYIERGVAQGAPEPAQAQAQNDWFYCNASRAYYPYVAQCPAGWQRVPAQPTSR